MAGSHSYHDRIQAVARKIEDARAQIYKDRDFGQTKMLIWTENELRYLWAIGYKYLRLKAGRSSREKALDDLLDIYNYCALFYEEILRTMEENGETPPVSNQMPTA